MVRKFFAGGPRFLNMGVTMLAKLLAEAKASPDIITLEATVVTGFEFLAVDECKEKCQPANIFRCQGRIFFNVKKDSYPNVLKMRSLDNLFLVSDAFEDVHFSGVKEEDTRKISRLVSKVDWDRSVPEWSELADFKGIQFPKCAAPVPSESIDAEPLCQNCLKAQSVGDKSDDVPGGLGADAPPISDTKGGQGNVFQPATPENVGLLQTMKSNTTDNVEIATEDVPTEAADEAFYSAEEDVPTEVDPAKPTNVVEAPHKTLSLGTFDSRREPKIEPIEAEDVAAQDPTDGHTDTVVENNSKIVGNADMRDVEGVLVEGEATDSKKGTAEFDELPIHDMKLAENELMKSTPAETFKIFVKNFPRATKKEDLTRLFETHGKVIECSIIKNKRTADAIAFVHMEREKEAQAALNHLNGLAFHGHRLYVAASKNKKVWTPPVESAPAERNGAEMTVRDGENTPQAADTNEGNTSNDGVAPKAIGEGRGRPADKKKKNHWQKLREEKEFREKQKANKRQPKPYIDDGILKFRVTCYRNGKHSFDSNDAAMHFGGVINDKFHWTVDLTRFDINVFLVIEGEDVYVSFGLTKSSFHRRNISHFGPTTLRSTMCYGLIRLAEPKVGDIVIDPLCGGGSISIEGAIGFPKTFHLCGDSNSKCMERTFSNINFNNKKNKINVDAFCWDTRWLPLKDQSVDILVTDLPFGLRIGKWKDNVPLYSSALTELARIVRCGTGRASLLTYDRTAMIKALRATGAFWREIRSVVVNQGGLKCFVYLLLRRANPDTPPIKECASEGMTLPTPESKTADTVEENLDSEDGTPESQPAKTE